MSERDPLVPVLAGLVVGIVSWLEGCDDHEVDPDSAVKMLESVAWVLEDLPAEQQERLVHVLNEMADGSPNPDWGYRLRLFPYACGLVADEPAKPTG
ncbi:hypothetical protein [Yinghuangia seranimata]|uniref:hypothetical protein n=1 Tax=Yinghuangia seranimata TaxID=408067 RepID=UPI00248BF427|nr:hypothetical protein [Yinghuangia seranimata]MDI2129137.1 hypothetical protein [Yinghuangia seranimata]